jgi:hypothetical protein
LFRLTINWEKIIVIIEVLGAEFFTIMEEDLTELKEGPCATRLVCGARPC